MIPIGSLLVILGIIMVLINQLQTKKEEKQLENYVKQRLGKTESGNPLCESHEMVAILVPEDQDDNQESVRNDLPKITQP